MKTRTSREMLKSGFDKDLSSQNILLKGVFGFASLDLGHIIQWLKV